jgi:small subunit ribosomal protein S5
MMTLTQTSTNGGSQELAITEKLLYINRVTKVVKGGKRLRFSALVVAGDNQSRVGIGIGKASEVPEAIRKGGVQAKKNMVTVVRKGTTIHHDAIANFGASKVLLKPATPGTGVIASDTVRAVLELAGIRDILSKSLGSPNRTNVVKATMRALTSLRDPAKEVSRRRGVPEAKTEKQDA